MNINVKLIQLGKIRLFVGLSLLLLFIMVFLSFRLLATDNKESIKYSQTTQAPRVKSVEALVTSTPTLIDKNFDLQRIADLSDIKIALDLYKTKHQYYPLSKNLCKWGWDSDSSPLFLKELVDEGYIQIIPTDPEGVGDTYCETMYGGRHYIYYSNGVKYVLMTLLSKPINDSIRMPLVNGDLLWFDKTPVKQTWNWKTNLYIIKFP